MSRLLPALVVAGVVALALVAAAASRERTAPGTEVAAVQPTAPRPAGAMEAALPRPLPPDPSPPAGEAGGPIPVAPAAGTVPVGTAGGSLAAWGPAPAPWLDPRRFTEAHWQGLEVVPRTPALAAALGLPDGVAGVIVDDVTLPADLQGFEAGDLVVAVGGTETPDLMAFLRATDALRDGSQATVTLLRDGERRTLTLSALGDRLGNGNGETASMIPPGARMPHAYRGPCTECHRIGSTGTLPVDQGDLLTRTAPVIRSGVAAPHRDRGPCETCHRILP